MNIWKPCCASNSRLLPTFDAVRLFHQYGFRDEANSRYGAKTDEKALDLFARHTAADGRPLFYKGSSADRKAAPIIPPWAAHAAFAEIGDFKPLRIFRKAA
ncbi:MULTISPECIES: hypothetical protein [unclassified Burkholderia]|uniref:hypothetical protein n=1 Tax=unclassified Burkholderia TaxID=2613784 RepID=UPI001FC82BEA|nr:MULTISPECIES: hypothetical protein [unclassified Burkholderia]